MMGESLIFMLMFALGSGGGGDLLDFTDVQSYWQMQEQRVVDVETMSAVLADEDATPTDKLMAVRALGELSKAADADKQAVLKVLTPLVDSKEPFVGQYAKRSIAWVKGEDPEPRPKPSAKDLEADLALLPHTSQIVGQVRVDNGVGPVDWDVLFPRMDRGEMAEMKQEMLREMNGMVGRLLGMIGNARLDAVSVGATFTGNGDDGYAMIVARGEYDRIAVQVVFEDIAEQEGDGDQFNFYSIGDIEVITIEDDWSAFAILMPSDNQFIFMVGDSDLGLKQYPIDETADLIQKGDAQLAFNETVTKHLKQIDRDKAEAWVAMQVPVVLRDEAAEFFGPIESGRATAIRNTEGNYDVSWTGEGNDADALAAAVARMNAELAEGRAEIREEMARNAEMRALFEPFVEMMDSIKVESEGKTMNGGMKLPGNAGSMMPMMMFGMNVQHDHAVPADVVQEAADPF